MNTLKTQTFQVDTAGYLSQLFIFGEPKEFYRWPKGADDIYKIIYIEMEGASAISEVEALQLVKSSATKERN